MSGRKVDDAMLEEMRQAASYMPVTFLGSRTFSDYRMVSLFGAALNFLQFAPILYFVLSVIFAGITKISYNKYQVGGK